MVRWYWMGGIIIAMAVVVTTVMSIQPSGVSEAGRSVLMELDQTWFTDDDGLFGQPGRRLFLEMIATDASFTMRGQDLSGFPLTPFIHEPDDSLPPGVLNDPVEVPMAKDGDVADLYRRITRNEYPTLKGELSGQYEAFLEG